MSPRKTKQVDQIPEDDLIAAISKWCQLEEPDNTLRPDWVQVAFPAGIGDDTALFRTEQDNCVQSLTTDMLVEGTHFLADHDPGLLGRKAIAVNLSDLASAGAWPVWVLISLGLPPDLPLSWLESFYKGACDALKPYAALCAGGDCVRSNQLAINVAVGGVCNPAAALPLRSKATPGQTLYTTGTLGDSAAGFWLIEQQWTSVGDGTKEKAEEGLPTTHGEHLPLGPRTSSPDNDDLGFLINRHRDPSPRIHAGIALAKACPDIAMMDLSDGLNTDLRRMAKASNCGFVVHVDALPVSDPLRHLEPHLEQSVRDYAILGGEDYELLFSTSVPLEAWRDQVVDAVSGEPVEVTPVGEVTREFVRFVDAAGREIALQDKAFRHFA